jgi:hypothetical protein
MTRAADRYAKKRDRGVCVESGCHTPTGGPCRCSDHAKAERLKQKKRRDDAAASGTCATCNEVPATGGGICDGCRERKKLVPSAGTNATREQRERDGVCIDCGDPLVGMISSRCEGCRRAQADQQADRRRERLARGLCGDCGNKPPVKGKTRCQGCGRKKRVAERVRQDEAA